MFDFLRRVLGGGGMEDVREAVTNGALIIDVRTGGEYRGGHVAGSRNIPLDELEHALDTLPKDKPIVFCCASGMRSGNAAHIAKARGFVALNGGPWTNVDSIRTRNGTRE